MSIKLTNTQRKNLGILSAHLLSLPEDYQNFGMKSFCTSKINDEDEEDGGEPIYPIQNQAKEIHNCGAVACALGHGIAAGVKNWKKFDEWNAYGHHYFGLEGWSDEWEWCFSGDWHYRDNTPQGAALRIKWLLEKGLPNNHVDQLYNEEVSLCYLESK